jgi:hypothetical protein
LDRPVRSLAAASALALTALVVPLAGPAGYARAQSDEPRAGEIEVFRGGERSVVRGTLDDPSLRDARGVLATRGVAVGAPGVVPADALAALGGPARARLTADLEAIGLVYGEVLELKPTAAVAEQLTALEAGEPLRLPHRHAASPTPLKPGQELAERLRHEASHAWVRALAPRAPAWLDEGLACYLEGLERPSAGKIRVRASARRHDALRSAGRAGRLPRRADLETLSRAELSGEAASAASWALAFSLMQTPEGRDVLRALLRGAAPGSLTARLDALGADALGADEPGALPRSWRRTASGDVAAQLLIAPPPPPTARQAAADEEDAEPRPRYRRALRCVRAVTGAGTPDARPVLFCTRRRATVDDSR